MAEEIEIVFTEELKKSYKELPQKIQSKFNKQVKFLKMNPKHQSLTCIIHKTCHRSTEVTEK